MWNKTFPASILKRTQKTYLGSAARQTSFLIILSESLLSMVYSARVSDIYGMLNVELDFASVKV